MSARRAGPAGEGRRQRRQRRPRRPRTSGRVIIGEGQPDQGGRRPRRQDDRGERAQGRRRGGGEGRAGEARRRPEQRQAARGPVPGDAGRAGEGPRRRDLGARAVPHLRARRGRADDRGTADDARPAVSRTATTRRRRSRSRRTRRASSSASRARSTRAWSTPPRIPDEARATIPTFTQIPQEVADEDPAAAVAAADRHATSCEELPTTRSKHGVIEKPPTIDDVIWEGARLTGVAAHRSSPWRWCSRSGSSWCRAGSSPRRTSRRCPRRCASWSTPARRVAFWSAVGNTLQGWALGLGHRDGAGDPARA